MAGVLCGGSWCCTAQRCPPQYQVLLFLFKLFFLCLKERQRWRQRSSQMSGEHIFGCHRAYSRSHHQGTGTHTHKCKNGGCSGASMLCPVPAPCLSRVLSSIISIGCCPLLPIGGPVMRTQVQGSGGAEGGLCFHRGTHGVWRRGTSRWLSAV